MRKRGVQEAAVAERVAASLNRLIVRRRGERVNELSARRAIDFDASRFVFVIEARR